MKYLVKMVFQTVTSFLGTFFALMFTSYLVFGERCDKWTILGEILLALIITYWMWADIIQEAISDGEDGDA